MSAPEYIVMDEDPPKYDAELASPEANLNTSVIELPVPVIKPELVDLVDEDEIFKCEIPNGNTAGELSLQDMEVLDEVKGDEEEITQNGEKVENEVNNEVKMEEEEKKQVTNETTILVNKEDAATQLSTANSDGPNTDPYAYIGQGGFTSENFKIELRGLPRYYGLAEIKKLLNDTLKLEYNKVKPPQMGKNHLFVCFRSEEGRKQAIETLHGYMWKKAKLIAIPAKPAPDPLVRKRRQDNEQGGAKAPKLDSADQLKQSTTPFWDKPYTAQLESKMEIMRKSLKEMGKQIVKVNPMVGGWLKQQEEKYDGLPCELKPIRPSPQIDGYRNKCEFTVGLNPETEKPTVGFRLGSYVSGEVGVYPADDLTHIPEKMKQCAKVFGKLVCESGLPPYHPEDRQGYWQSLSVRMTRGGQLMICISVHVDTLKEENQESMKQDITKFFVEGEGKELNVNSLYFHPLVRKVKGVTMPEPILLHGEAYITEDLLGLKLRISPLAFFQVNTLAAEELYQAVSELAKPTPDTTLIDICCGTGSIGLSLAKDCGQVLGLEMIQSAVGDAKANAKTNELNHCEFFTGLAENILGSVLERSTRPNLVGVLDPPRPGVPQRVITTIRRSPELNRLVYMACNPAAAQHNFRDLGRPTSKTMPGNPMLPVCAIPVDLFPHTPHCELVILFERVDPSTLPEPPQEYLDNAAKDQHPPNNNPGSGKKNKRNRNRRDGGRNFLQVDLTGGNDGASGPNDGIEIVHYSPTKKPRNKILKRLVKRGLIPDRPGLMGPRPGMHRQGNNRPGLMGARPGMSRSTKRRVQRNAYNPPPLLSHFGPSTKVRGMGRGLGPMRANLGRQSSMSSNFRGQRAGGRQTKSLMGSGQVIVNEFPEDVGRSWGNLIPSNALQNEDLLRKEEEEAVRRFKEGFSAAVKDSQAKLLDVQDIGMRRNEESYQPRNRFGNARGRGKSFGYAERSRYEERLATSGPQPFQDAEKMVPISTVNQILDQYRRGFEQQNFHETHSQYEPRGLGSGQVKIREVYVEKEAWAENQPLTQFDREKVYANFSPRKELGYNRQNKSSTNVQRKNYNTSDDYHHEDSTRTPLIKNAFSNSQQHFKNQDAFQNTHGNSFRGRQKRIRKRKNNMSQGEERHNDYNKMSRPQSGRGQFNKSTEKRYGASNYLDTVNLGRANVEYGGIAHARENEKYQEQMSQVRDDFIVSQQRAPLDQDTHPPSLMAWKKPLSFETSVESGSSPPQYQSILPTSNSYSKSSAFATKNNTAMQNESFTKTHTQGYSSRRNNAQQDFPSTYARRDSQQNLSPPSFQQKKSNSSTFNKPPAFGNYQQDWQKINASSQQMNMYSAPARNSFSGSLASFDSATSTQNPGLAFSMPGNSMQWPSTSAPWNFPSTSQKPNTSFSSTPTFPTSFY